MIEYRDATSGDAAALAELFKRVFCDTFAHLYSEEDLQSFLAEHGEELWRSQLNDPDFAVRIAADGQELAGYAKLGPVKLPVDDPASARELRQLYVLGKWHGSGIASVLMDWTIAEARRRRASALYLSVYTGNPRAQRFYDRFGFTAVGPYTFMVGNQPDEDAIMRLAL